MKAALGGLVGRSRTVRFWLPSRCLKLRREKDRTDHGIRPSLRRANIGKDFNQTGLTVALVGRPNVGKSTLYNRLIDVSENRGVKAIVHSTAGVTRDVTYAEAVLHDLRFHVFDTAGLEEHLEQTRERKPLIRGFNRDASVAALAAMDETDLYRALYRDMAIKTAWAVEKADTVLFITDAIEGSTCVDREVAKWLRSIHPAERVILVANKYDHRAAENNYHDFFELGFGEPVPLSAAQGMGLADLYNSLRTAFDHRLGELLELENAKQREAVALLSSPAAEQEEKLALPQPEETSMEERTDEDKSTPGDSESAEDSSQTEEEGKAKAQKKKLKLKTAEDLDVGLPNDIVSSSKWKAAIDANDRDILVAVIGQPNVGKSTLVNKLLGTKVCLTGPAPGVTRDPIWIDHVWKGKPVKLVDTAGIRSKAKVESPLEMKSMLATIHSVKASHIVILLMDARNLWAPQDIKLAKMVLAEGRCLLIALNKWDLIVEKDRETTRKLFHEKTQNLFPATRNMKMVTISALYMQKHTELLETACKTHERWSHFVKTVDLNNWLTNFKKLVPVPKKSGNKTVRKFNLLFVAQSKARPPTFTFRGATIGQIPNNYLRALENGLRREFDWAGIPIRLKFLPRTVEPQNPVSRTK